MLLTLEMPDALRPSELFALRWRSFDGSRLTISETVYKGKIRPFGKTEKSLGDVLLPKGMVDDLWLWKQECPDSSLDAFIFPNTDGGFMDSGNYRNRILNPLAERLWITETELPGPAQNHGNAGAAQGVGEGHPSSPAALQGRHHGQRVHAGVAGECRADG